VQCDHLTAERGHFGCERDTVQSHALFSKLLFGKYQVYWQFLSATSRTTLYHFQHVIFHSGCASSLWSFRLSSRYSSCLSDTPVHIAQHSPVWHSTIRKSPPIFVNRCSYVSITKVIYPRKVSIFVVCKCSHLNQSLCSAHSNKTELHVTTY
jgi:hypothetical protein